MVKKHLEVENAAVKLGFMNFPLTVLYGKLKSWRPFRSSLDKTLDFFQVIGGYKSGFITDTARLIIWMLELMYQLKPEKLKNINKPSEKPRFFFGYGVEKKVHKYYYLAPTEKLYIELNNKTGTMKKQGFQLKIYSLEEEHKYKIAKMIDELYGGILNHVDNWEHIEEYFNVSSEECIRNWNSILEKSEQTDISFTKEQISKLRLSGWWNS
jgi:hypothetical protein